MEIEALKRSHLKRNIIIGVFVVLIISVVVVNFTRAKYRVTQSIPLVNGIINYTPYDFNVIAMYQQNENNEYTSIDKVPTIGYVLNTTESYCEVNGAKDENIKITYENGFISFSGMSYKGTKCRLYFDLTPFTIDDILASKTILTRDDPTQAFYEDTTGKIYQAEDDDGTTYYFAGNPTDNWVYFGGFYWRIIRVNGDGSIRMIYSGSDSTGPVTIGTETAIGESIFNKNDDDNAYVGYMYTLGEVHGIETPSAIKTYIDEWYQNNLINYTEKIDGNAGFCGDRTPYRLYGSSGNYTYTSGGGTGTTETYYGFWRRNWYANSSVYVTLKCENSNDLYTTKGSSKGNKALTYPVGLITADEAVFAGGLFPNETSRTYLHSDVIYWTITPWRYLRNAIGSTVSMYGPFAMEYDISKSMSVRPVINLKSDTLFKAGGIGTDDNPFEVY